MAVDTEGDNGEDELDSANREVEIKSHCWEVCDLGVEYLDLVKAKKKMKKVGCCEWSNVCVQSLCMIYKYNYVEIWNRLFYSRYYFFSSSLAFFSFFLFFSLIVFFLFLLLARIMNWTLEERGPGKDGLTYKISGKYDSYEWRVSVLFKCFSYPWSPESASTSLWPFYYPDLVSIPLERDLR